LANTGIKFRFRLTCIYKDVALLCAIRNYFKSGTISKIRKDTEVVTLNNLKIHLFDFLEPFKERVKLFYVS
jgi:hypothetical protein